MVVLTGVRRKPMFGLFDRCATRIGLKNSRLMAGSGSFSYGKFVPYRAAKLFKNLFTYHTLIVRSYSVPRSGMASLQPNRNIPCMWDIFGKPAPRDDPSNCLSDFQKLKLDNGSSCSDSNGNDSAISVGSASDEDLYFNSGGGGGHNAASTGTSTKKKKRFGRKEIPTEPEVKYLERHLSMKKTIRKKIMRDLQKAFVEDPNEFRVEDIPPEQLKAEINLQSLSFASGGKKKDKKNNESNFLDFLRTGSGIGGGECKTTGSAAKSAKNRGYKDADGDSGHGSPATEESEEEDKKTSFWKRFTMKGSRSKR